MPHIIFPKMSSEMMLIFPDILPKEEEREEELREL